MVLYLAGVYAGIGIVVSFIAQKKIDGTSPGESVFGGLFWPVLYVGWVADRERGLWWRVLTLLPWFLGASFGGVAARGDGAWRDAAIWGFGSWATMAIVIVVVHHLHKS